MKTLSQLLQEALDFHRKGQLHEAETIYRQIIAQAPGHAYTLNLLGLVRHQQGDQEQAKGFLQQAIAVEPGNATYHASLGLVNEAAHDTDKAVKNYRKALRLAPDNPETHFLLGKLLLNTGRHAEAIEHFQHATRIKPDHLGALSHLGRAYHEAGQFEEAIAQYRKILSLDPENTGAHFDLGTVQREQGDLEAARRSFEQVVRLNPGDAMAYNNLGTIMKDLGRAEEAVCCFEQAHALEPGIPIIYSNLLFTLAYNVMGSMEEIFEAHRQWDRLYACKDSPSLFSHKREGAPDKRLRIGYISPDLRNHPVSYFFEPILKGHSRDEVEVFCYAEVSDPDVVTRRLQREADHWRSTVGMTDEEVVHMIHRDGIDILVDLAGHTANNRLRALTFKPAPVQATYLGYFSTTGLAAMDYWISDEILHPHDSPERSTETVFRLPRCCLSYSPSPDAPPVSPREAGQAITFGSFNHLTKITPDCIALWSEVLNAVPDSRLLLKNRQLVDPAIRASLEAQFASHGIDPARLTLLSHIRTYAEHMAAYGRMDISLDTIPRTGGSTTADALWMGVPVITLAGERFIQRLSATMISAVGLEKLIATSREDYVAKAVALAQDGQGRAVLRSTLRERMAASPLCDAQGLAQALETAYRKMWVTFLNQDG